MSLIFNCAADVEPVTSLVTSTKIQPAKASAKIFKNRNWKIPELVDNWSVRQLQEITTNFLTDPHIQVDYEKNHAKMLCANLGWDCTGFLQEHLDDWFPIKNDSDELVYIQSRTAGRACKSQKKNGRT